MDHREIDSLIAEHIMKWEKHDNGRFREYLSNGNVNQYFVNGIEKDTWFPSTNIEHAWLVDDKLRKYRHLTLSDMWDEDEQKILYYCNFQYNDTCHMINYDAFSETAPMAICLAALKLHDIEIDQ